MTGAHCDTGGWSRGVIGCPTAVSCHASQLEDTGRRWSADLLRVVLSVCRQRPSFLDSFRAWPVLELTEPTLQVVKVDANTAIWRSIMWNVRIGLGSAVFVDGPDAQAGIFGGLLGSKKRRDAIGQLPLFLPSLFFRLLLSLRVVFRHGPLHTSNEEDQRERYSPEPPRRKLCVTVIVLCRSNCISDSLFVCCRSVSSVIREYAVASDVFDIESVS